jgi:DoxX-like family
MTPPIPKWARIAGFVLHCLIAALFLFAGTVKIIPLMPLPAEQVTKMGPVLDWIVVIGIGEIITAILLVIPRTSSLGVLLVSGLWGGIISFNMSKGDTIIPWSIMLLVTWIAAFVRNPAVLSSFFPTPQPTQNISEPKEPVLS